MKFKLVSFESVKESLSNYLMKFYKGTFEDLKKHIFLNIPQNLYIELKKRPIKDEELKELLSRLDNNKIKEKTSKIKDLWNNNERDILKEISDITGLNIETENITCEINPYTSHGFYGEDNISLGIGGGITDDYTLLVISHELFHIVYWRRLHELNITQSKIGSEEFWEWSLAEVTDYMLLKEDKLVKFWPTSKHFLYPDIEEVYKKVKPLWKSVNFDEYLIKSYDILRNGK